MDDLKTFWDNIYRTKNPQEVSWTQNVPLSSLSFIKELAPEKSASIIDIGGGNSNLTDFLLDEGYEDITILDISSTAIDKAKNRLGARAERVTWIVSDIVSFKPERKYDVWHDRATFHFLTEIDQISAYLEIAEMAADKYLIIGTFSQNGPSQCSGLPVRRYSDQHLQTLFSRNFITLKCTHEDHITPFGTTQHFVFCSFKTQS